MVDLLVTCGDSFGGFFGSGLEDEDCFTKKLCRFVI